MKLSIRRERIHVISFYFPRAISLVDFVFPVVEGSVYSPALFQGLLTQHEQSRNLIFFLALAEIVMFAC